MNNYKFYFRKSSFKKDIKNANLLLEILKENKPLNFLEVGVLEGVTSRNICELLKKIHNRNFTFTGIDLFGEDVTKNNQKEFTPISNKISNPIKWFFFKIILRMNPHSKRCVEYLLRKFKNSITIHQGYSKDILEKINLKKINFVFLDGGHSYNTVKDDLSILISKLANGSIILCDDYNIKHYGVKKAVDEFKKMNDFIDYGRFAFLKVKK